MIREVTGHITMHKVDLMKAYVGDPNNTPLSVKLESRTEGFGFITKWHFYSVTVCTWHNTTEHINLDVMVKNARYNIEYWDRRLAEKSCDKKEHDQYIANYAHVIDACANLEIDAAKNKMIAPEEYDTPEKRALIEFSISSKRPSIAVPSEETQTTVCVHRKLNDQAGSSTTVWISPNADDHFVTQEQFRINEATAVLARNSAHTRAQATD